MPFWADIVGAMAAVIGTVCWLPQSIRTIRTRDTSGLSLWSNLLLFTAVSLWLVYGLALGSWPIICANAVSMLLIGTIVCLKLRYG